MKVALLVLLVLVGTAQSQSPRTAYARTPEEVLAATYGPMTAPADTVLHVRAITEPLLPGEIREMYLGEEDNHVRLRVFLGGNRWIESYLRIEEIHVEGCRTGEIHFSIPSKDASEAEQSPRSSRDPWQPSATRIESRDIAQAIGAQRGCGIEFQGWLSSSAFEILACGKPVQLYRLAPGEYRIVYAGSTE